MKKILLFGTMLAILFSVTSCDKDDGKNTANSTDIIRKWYVSAGSPNLYLEFKKDGTFTHIGGRISPYYFNMEGTYKIIETKRMTISETPDYFMFHNESHTALTITLYVLDMVIRGNEHYYNAGDNVLQWEVYHVLSAGSDYQHIFVYEFEGGKRRTGIGAIDPYGYADTYYFRD